MITITPMTIEHYGSVYSLWEQTEGLILGEADMMDRITDYLKQNPGLSAVAIVNDQVVGAILCGHDGRRAFVYHLAVERSLRGKGIGRGLVDHCLMKLASIGIELSHIFILNDHEVAISFWRHMGWEKRTDVAAFSKRL